MSRRRYFGSIRASKAWAGPKAIDIYIEPEQAIPLAIAILRAAELGLDVDITAHHAKVGRDGKFQVTITSPPCES